MNEELKRRLEKIEKRLNAIEGFLEEFPVYIKPTTFEAGDAVDDLYEQALWIVIQHDRVSASLIQRRMQIGFNRAARLLEQLEENGIIGPFNGVEPRKVLIKHEELEALRQKLSDKKEQLEKRKKQN